MHVNYLTIKYFSTYIRHKPINVSAAFIWLLFISTVALYLWFREGWFHLELLTVSEHVRNRGYLTIFDWKVFDINPARIRLLSDFIEVIDAILRPHTVIIFGYHPSLSLTSIFMALTCPVFFYKTLRLVGLSRSESIVLAAALISTIGYLSCFIPYIRPAKRLAFTGLSIILFLTFQYIKRPEKNNFWWLIILLFLTLFTDEASYAYLVIVIILLYMQQRKYYYLIYIGIPALYLFISKVVLPPIYDLYGLSGPRDGVIAGSIVIKLLYNLMSYDFWILAFEDLYRSAAASFGALSIIPTLLIMLIIVSPLIFFKQRSFLKNYTPNNGNSLLLSLMLSIIFTSLFLSMLDMINTSRNYMAQWAYYYHSPMALLYWLLAALYYKHVKETIIINKWYFIVLITAITMLNLLNFYHVNEIIKIIHLYPIKQTNPLLIDEKYLIQRFNNMLSYTKVYEAKNLQKQFEYYQLNPMGTIDYINRLQKTFQK